MRTAVNPVQYLLMSFASELKPRSGSSLHAVPLTIEGAYVLHQMVRFRWPLWRSLDAAGRGTMVSEFLAAFTGGDSEGTRWSGLYSLLGHKGDLMLVHFRHSLDELQHVELQLVRSRLWDYFEVVTSYVSVVELGLYESSVKLYRTLMEGNVQQHSPEWNAAVEDTLQRQKQAMHGRLYPEMPSGRYISFYPMDRKRGEDINWYTLPIEERQRQMEEHGMVGRRYAGTVKQIITGSIGFDDWEWGVDLFADDPLVFKKLIYEMRFDQVSAVYAAFGQFLIGIRVEAAELAGILNG